MKKTRLLALVLLIGTSSRSQFYYEGAKELGSSGVDHGVSVTTDAAGNVYNTGYFSGTVDFDPGAGIQNLTSTGNTDIYILKFNAAGNLVWAKCMGGSNDDYSYGIALDASGNVYTTGIFQGTVDFDPGAGTQNLVSVGTSDMYISKLDAAGNFVWAKKIGGAGAERAQGIVVDAAGNAYITGCFTGTVDFDPGAGVSNLISNGSYDVFVSKLSTTGDLIWARNMGGPVADYGSSIAIDGAGNVCTTGTFANTADFDPGTGTHNLVTAAFDDIFISKLDGSGNFVWAKRLGGGVYDYSYSIVTDAAGNIYTTAMFEGTIDFDPGAGTTNLTAAGSLDVYVTKFDALGNYVWAKSLGGAGAEVAYSIAVDIAGNVYTTGYFQGTADFDPGAGVSTLTSAGSDDIFISKLDAAGNYVWAEKLGGANAESGTYVVVNSTGKLYLTGYFNGTADFDPGAGTQNLTSQGGMDIFVAKYDLTGTLPLSLLEFSARNNNNTVQLNWQTAGEENTASFVIERSNDGKSFSSIGSVKALNNTSFKKSYTFTDGQPVNSTTFYRLKMTDVDGRFTYSQLASVRRSDDATALQLTPNPVRNVLYIQAKGNEAVTVQITNINGRILQQQSATLSGNTSLSVNIQQLLPGNYYVLVRGKQVNLVQSFVKQ